MIVIVDPDIEKTSAEYRQLLDHLTNLPNIQVREHEEQGG